MPSEPITMTKEREAQLRKNVYCPAPEQWEEIDAIRKALIRERGIYRALFRALEVAFARCYHADCGLMRERGPGGRTFAKVVAIRTLDGIHGEIHANVEIGSQLYTDDHMVGC